MKNRLATLIFLFVWILSACTVIDVQVGAPTDTPQPQTQFRPGEQPPGMQREDDQWMRLREIAFPNLVVDESGPAVALFEQSLPEVDYVIIDAQGYRLRAPWNALWLGSAQGMQQLWMELQVLPPWNTEYETWDYSDTGEMYGDGPELYRDLLDVSLWLDSAGMYSIRVLLSGQANQFVGEQTFTEQTEQEFQLTLVALNQPEEIPSDAAFFEPRFGDNHWSGAFLDWRSWQYGPCDIISQDAAITSLLDQACLGAENGDWGSVDAALQAVLASASEGQVIADTRAMLGLLAAANVQWPVAARHFREAVNFYGENNQAIPLVSALHNQGVSEMMAGRPDEGTTLLLQAGDMRDTLGDWPAWLLTWGQMSLHWQNPDYARSLADEMSSAGMSMADALWSAADALPHGE